MITLNRLCRYFGGKPRLVFRAVFQKSDSIECCSDTDWAGCPRTRKSTSGGVLLLGQHILKTFSSTQLSVTLSSGVAEFYGVVKAIGVALGQKSLFGSLGPTRLPPSELALARAWASCGTLALALFWTVWMPARN